MTLTPDAAEVGLDISGSCGGEPLLGNMFLGRLCNRDGEYKAADEARDVCSGGRRVAGAEEEDMLVCMCNKS